MSNNDVVIEEMGEFFNLRADIYEKHMEETVTSFNDYYKMVSAPIENTIEPIQILDLGCGTGLEIEGIFEKAPNAVITCIDLSEGMLNKLKEKYKGYSNNLKIINSSYLEYDLESNKYDYVCSVMTMHHFVYEQKLELYNKIKLSLKEGGKYIEGDYVVSKYYEKKWLKRRESLLNEFGQEGIKLYHIDIPFAVSTQKRLFKQAGFKEFNILWEQEQQYICEVK